MQTTNTILLIRPSNFVFNSQTADSNAFQNNISGPSDQIRKKVFDEFEKCASTLISKGLNVHILDDTDNPHKPDAIFPNNWISFHADGTVILYPMYAKNRRVERRNDVVEYFAKTFQINNIIDLSAFEEQGKFLEGTGSIVFDHTNKRAYACLSPRTDKDLFLKVCDFLYYRPICFYAHDKNGKEIYHTNVMMCMGERFAVICLSSLTKEEEKKQVFSSLNETGHRIIDISFEQMNGFAGNMLELKTKIQQSILVLSQTAFDFLRTEQIQAIEQHCEILPLSIPTIETIGGGSARCMIAEVFAQPRL